MASNLLVVNPIKTGYIANKNGLHLNSTIMVGKDEIKSSKSEKLLGITISSDLTWTEHFKSIRSALNQRLFIIRRLKESMPQKELEIVAEAIFNSKIRYGLAAFATCRIQEENPINGQINALQKVQNTMIRTIQGKKISDKVSIKQLLENSIFTSVNQTVVKSVLNEVYNILNYDTVPFIKDLLMREELNYYNTRSHLKPHLIVTNVKKCKFEGFLQRGAKVWNCLVQKCDTTATKNFKSLTKEFVKSLPI